MFTQKSLLWVLACSCIFNVFTCCTTSKTHVLRQPDYESLEEQIHELVRCLNERDFDCVEQCYAEDFVSYNPKVIVDSRKNFIEKLKKNYTENQYRLEVEIGEIDAGPEHAHALLSWKMYAPEGDGEMLIFHKMNCSIWVKSGKRSWQLSRMVFFVVEE